MINIRGIANSVVQSVNPNTIVGWVRSTGGYTTTASGARTPITSAETIQAQVQPMSAGDLQHIDGLNINGVMRSVYLFGNAQGVVRADQKGGDILQFPEVPGAPVRNWRVSAAIETWPTWSKVVVVLQNP